MAAAHAIILAVGFFALLAVMVLLMRRVNRNELQRIERRRQKWIEAGSNPDDEPNFFSGSPGN
jgi:hypothetical protein